MKLFCKDIFLSIVIAGTLFAQNNDLSFEHLSIEQGLSQSTVHSIIQDKQGFIWIGTEDGLNRFDGYNFTVYRNDREDSTSIANNYIRAIVQDNNGNLWIGTSKGLTVLTLINTSANQKNKEGFYNFYHAVNDSLSLIHNDIRTLYFDKFGVLWIGTFKGLCRVVPDSDATDAGYFKNIRFEKNIFNPEFTEAVSGVFISSITEDGNGNLWIGTLGKGIIFCNRQTSQIVKFRNDPNNPGSLGSNFIIKLFTDLIGRVWVGTYGGGLNRYDYNSRKFIRYIPDSHTAYSISDNRIFGLSEDEDGNLWVGTFSGGINKFDVRTNRFIEFKNNKQNPGSISNNFVRCLLVDRSGNLWAGTNNGINKADLKKPKFELFRNVPWGQDNISDNFVLSIFEDDKSRLWVGTNKGLDRYDAESGKFINYKIPHNNPKSGEGFVRSIIQDNDGFLWLGTFGGGIIKCSSDGKIIRQYLNKKDDKNSLPDNRVNTLLLQRNGNIIVGTVVGICQFEQHTKKFNRFLISSKDSTQLSGKAINVIYKDRNDIFWIGTSLGLIRVDPIDGNCTEFLANENDPGSISSNNINSVTEDRRGNIWIGTDKGLNKLDRKTNTFTLFTTRNGLPNDYISGIEVDNNGNLWLSTVRGISRFNPSVSPGQQFRNYDTEDGLQGLEFIDGSSFKNSKGIIYFGGTNGFNKFDPSEIKDNPKQPDVAITAFYLFGKPQLSYLQLSNTEAITLGYSENFFSFEFNAFDYTNPDKNQYAYQLEGFDKDWVDIGNRRFASYTNIDPGEYTFRVKASNNDGIWNETGTSIGLIIKPPFYRTWLAYIIYILFAGTGLYALRKFELRKRREKNELLLKEEREKSKLTEVQLRAEKAELQAQALKSEKELEEQKIRARIASDLHDEIGSNLSSITLLSSLMSSETGENQQLYKQLADINVAAKTSAEAIRDIIWFINPTSDNLNSLLVRMKDTAITMLSGLNHEISIAETNAEDKINPELKRNVYLVFKESLNNIIKHSSAKNVLIKINKTDNRLNVFIEDDGKGFDKSSVKEGNGLRNIRNRAAQINAELEINSLPGNGTKINFAVNIT